MHELIRKISLTGIVPEIKIEDAEKAVPVARALCKGGIPVAEITFSTEQGEEAIARISKEMPEIILGAGTVLTTDQVDRAVNAGAQFIASPGLNPKVVGHCMSKGIPITPGCTNPNDIEKAIGLGLDVVKFFPSEASGGIRMIKALADTYGNIRFIPEGGIDANNLNDYLSFPKVLACGGSWMVPDNIIHEGDFEKITILAKVAMESMLGFALAHVGLNCENEEQANHVACNFSRIFNFDLIRGNGSILAGNMVELMNAPYRGTHGHIAIKTNYINRAVNYLSSKSIDFEEKTAKFDAKGNLKAIYLKKEIGGFAIHLLQQ